MKSWNDQTVALAVKGSKLITVNGTVYRWRLRRTPTYVQECFDAPLTFAVLNRPDWTALAEASLSEDQHSVWIAHATRRISLNAFTDPLDDT